MPLLPCPVSCLRGILLYSWVPTYQGPFPSCVYKTHARIIKLNPHVLSVEEKAQSTSPRPLLEH